MEILLTLDIDWAPDWMINLITNILIKNRVKTTWFATHRSPAVDRLDREKDLFEVGIHPNFLPSSTHGRSEDTVLNHIKTQFPDAVSMRTHGLYQTTNLLRKCAELYGIKIDVSMFIPGGENIEIHKLHFPDATLWRVPFCWEDDFEVLNSNPLWTLPAEYCRGNGLKIFNFHPVHIIRNTTNPNVCWNRKQSIPDFEEISENEFNHHVEKNGPKCFFMEIVNHMAGKGTWIKELVHEGL